MKGTDMSKTYPTRFIIVGIIYMASLGCASSPPSQTLPQSKVAVSSVNNENYKRHVRTEVAQLVNKLKQAEAADNNKQHTQAEQLAEQILLDVELIQLKTQRIIAEQEAQNLEANINGLNKELEWREPVELTPLDQ